MTRREEIEKAAFNYINSDVVSAENMQLAFGDFINGAEWADKTIIDKAILWLTEKGILYVVCESDLQDLIHDFTKAMKD